MSSSFAIKLTLLVLFFAYVGSFHSNLFGIRGIRQHARERDLSMVFDFLQKRSEEGIAQLTNLAKKTAEGKMG